MPQHHHVAENRRQHLSAPRIHSHTLTVADNTASTVLESSAPAPPPHHRPILMSPVQVMAKPALKRFKVSKPALKRLKLCSQLSALLLGFIAVQPLLTSHEDLHSLAALSENDPLTIPANGLNPDTHASNHPSAVAHATASEQRQLSPGLQLDHREHMVLAGTPASQRSAQLPHPRSSDADATHVKDRTATSDNHDARCAKYVVYDKPVKTGSTAITQALKEMLWARRPGAVVSAKCQKDECLGLAEQICTGQREPVNLLQHINGKAGVLDCLRERRYYVATSIRDPLSRWESAFLYNRREKGRHYDIEWEKSYGEFMQLMPACALHHYLDGLDWGCRGNVGVPERVRRIVARYDEIIDLEDEPAGTLEMLLKPFLKRTNTSPWPEGEVREAFDRSRLENETMLYEALKRKRVELLQRPKTRQLCLR